MLRTRFFISLLLKSWLGLLCSPLLADPLIVGVSDNHSAPFIFHKQGQVTGGILKDLVDELGQRLNLDVHYRLLPRNRLKQNLDAGRIHLLPHVNPAWYTDIPELLWSPPWLLDQDLFITARRYPLQIERFEDLAGKRVGTIRGYRYPRLDRLFQIQSVSRKDARSLAQNFRKLAAGRIDALVDSKLMIDYFLEHHPDADQFQQANMIAAEHQRFIAISPQAPCSIEALSRQLQQMIDEGVVRQIIARYR